MKPTFLAALALTSLPVLLMAVPAMAEAHEAGPAPAMAAGNTLLTVSAEGSSARKPDLALFSAGVTSSGKTAGEALAANSADMSRVITALKRAGIADKDIQTSQLSLNPVYAQQRPRTDSSMEPEQPLIIGYQVTNTVSVRQRKIGEFGAVIDTLVSAGANQVNGPSFQIDNPDEAMDEARTEALAKARARANLYARAAGLKVLRILSISEAGGYAPQPQMMNTRATAADSGGAPPVAAGEVSLNASVTVQFELAP
jgi:uncharacterized protein